MNISLVPTGLTSGPSDGDCVFQREVTVDVWRNLTDSARDAKMPSDEFFQ